MKTTKDRFEEKIFYSPDGCWYWMGTVRNGYGLITYNRSRKNKVVTLKSSHRFSFELYKGTITEGLFVCHTCDNRLCVNPDHLYAGTHDENMRDVVSRNRLPSCKGSLNKNSSITEDEAKNIKGLLAIGLTPKLISMIRKVTRSTIYAIRKGNTWNHV